MEFDYNYFNYLVAVDNGVFQCDRNPKKGATQYASGTTFNESARNLKRSATIFIQKSGQEISLKIV